MKKRREIKRGCSRLGHVAPGMAEGLLRAGAPPVKDAEGVAMETPQCFPFPNYMAAGCQLEPLKRIPAVAELR